MTEKRPYESKKPILFAAYANDAEGRLDYLDSLSTEARRLRDVLEAAKHRDHYQVIERQNASLDDILHILRRYRDRIAVFHYAGHSDSYGLLLQGKFGGNEVIDADGFAKILAQQSGLQLVFLNGCANQAQVDGLVEASVPAVIATSGKIEDSAATEFAVFFYQSLGAGASLQTAFDEASAAIEALAGEALFSLGDDDIAPWALETAADAPTAHEWRVLDAAGDPLLDLPALPDLDLPPQPFRYLEWFRREDAEIFFGRNWEIASLYNLITAEAGSPLILYFGQSGVGKSSLLAAGLLPRLESDYAVIYARREQALGLTGTLAQALTQAPAQPTGASVDGLNEAWHGVERQTAKPLLIVLDQVEECFTRPSDQHAQEMSDFVSALVALFGDGQARPQGTLILSFRKEWLAEITSSLENSGLSPVSYFLKQMEDAGIMQAVAGPASSQRLYNRYRLTVEEGLPEEIAVDLSADQGSSIAPTLQVLLSKLWDEATAASYDPAFSRALYRDLQQKGLLLSDFLDQQLGVLHERRPSESKSGLVLDILAQHTTSLGTAEQCVTATLLAQYPHPAESITSLLGECRSLYLLVDPEEKPRKGATASRLAHDTLAPLVRQRFDESDAPGQRARRILESRIHNSGTGNGAERATLDEVDLAIVETGLTGMRLPNEDETDLIERSRVERAERARKRRQNRRRVFAGGLLLGLSFVVAAALGINNWLTQQRADIAQDMADSRGLADQAIEMLSLDPELSILIALKAITSHDHIAEAVDALRLALAQNRADTTFGRLGDPAVTAVAYSPTGTQAVTGHADGTIVRWDAATGEQIEAWQALADLPVQSLLIEPSGRRLFAGGGADILIWEIDDEGHSPTPVHVLGHVTTVHTLAMHPDGIHLASGDNNGILRLWRATDEIGLQPVSTWESNSSVNDVAFSSDGALMASGSKNGYVFVWDVSDLENPAQTAAYQHEQQVHGVGFGPCNAIQAEGESCRRLLVSSSQDKSARVWMVGDEGQRPTILQHTGAVYDAFFDESGKHVTTLGADGRVLMWDVERRQVTEALAGHRKQVVTMAMDPQAPVRLLTGSSDGTGKAWVLPQSRKEIESLAFHPDGHRLVAATNNGALIVRTYTDGELLATEEIISAHDARILDIAFQPPDGSILAAAGWDGILSLWNTVTWTALARIDCGIALTSLVYSPNGGMLFVVAEDGRLFHVDEEAARPCQTLDDAGGTLVSIDISPDGQVLAASSLSGSVHLYQLNGYELGGVFNSEQETHPVETGTAFSVLFDPGDPENLLVSGDGSNAAAMIFDNAANVFEHRLTGLPGHTAQVNTMGIDRAGEQLATAGANGKVLVWNIDDLANQPRPILLPVGTNAFAVDFHPSDPFVAVGDGWGRITLHPLEHEDLVAGARKMLTHPPFESDCNRFFESVDECLLAVSSAIEAE